VIHGIKKKKKTKMRLMHWSGAETRGGVQSGKKTELSEKGRGKRGGKHGANGRRRAGRAERKKGKSVCAKTARN